MKGFFEILVFPAASFCLAMQNSAEILGIPKKMFEEVAVVSQNEIYVQAGQAINILQVVTIG